MTLPKRLFAALAVAAILAACAPRTDESTTIPLTPTPPQNQPQTPPASMPGAPDLSNPAVKAVDSAAKKAFYLMGLNYEQSGTYDVATIATDLELPTGVKWQLQDLSEASYTLRFTSDSVPELAWLVTPEGVTTEEADPNRIL